MNGYDWVSPKINGAARRMGMDKIINELQLFDSLKMWQWIVVSSGFAQIKLNDFKISNAIEEPELDLSTQ